MAALAMMFGCFGTSTALAQNGKDAEKGGKKLIGSYGTEHQMVNVGPSVTMEEAVSKLVKGKTTLDELVELLGPPMQLINYGEGTNEVNIATYHWRAELRGGQPNIGRAIGDAMLGPFSIGKAKKRVAAAQQAMDEVRTSFKMLTATFGPGGTLKGLVTNPAIMPKKPAPPSGLKVVTPPEKASAEASLIAATPSP